MANGKGECVCSVLAKTITTNGGIAAPKSDCGKQVQQRVRLTIPAPSEGVAAPTAGSLSLSFARASTSFPLIGTDAESIQIALRGLDTIGDVLVCGLLLGGAATYRNKTTGVVDLDIMVRTSVEEMEKETGEETEMKAPA